MVERLWLPAWARERLFEPALADLDRAAAAGWRSRIGREVRVALLWLESLLRAVLEWGRALFGRPSLSRGPERGGRRFVEKPPAAYRTLGQDLRWAWRALVARPLFAGLVIAVLGLAIGANLVFFALLESIVLSPLPYPEPEELFFLAESTLVDGRRIDASLTAAGFLDWRRDNETFQSISGYYAAWLNVVGDDGVERTRGLWVSSDFFESLQTPAAIGRTFEGDATAWERGEVLIGDGYWRRRFGGRADAIGAELQISDATYRVVGVLQAGFEFLDPAIDLYLASERDVPPLPIDIEGDYHDNRDLGYFEAVGRLREGVAAARAVEDIEAIQVDIRRRFPDAQHDRGAVVRPLHQFVVGDVGGTLRGLVAAVGSVLLIAAANVAGLTLARAASRRRELAVRAALGASRLRLMRQLLLEGGLSGLLGGLLGSALAVVTLGPLARSLPAAVPRTASVGVDLPLAIFSLILSVVCGLVCGLLPALQAVRGDFLREVECARGAGAPRGYRLRSALVIGEIAMSLILVAAAGLVLQGFLDMVEVDPGFEPAGVVVSAVTLPEDRYESDPSIVAFHRRALERLTEVPGVEAAALVLALPFSGRAARVGLFVEGQPIDEQTRQQRAIFQPSSPGYFRAMGIPLLVGRTFEADDVAGGEPVAIVNRALIDRYFPAGADPLEVGIHFGDEAMLRVVGVVGDVRHAGYGSEPEPELYLPFAQAPFRFATYVIRGGPEIAAGAEAIRAALRSVDPLQPLAEIRPLPSLLAGSVADRRLTAWVVGAFASIALALAALGVFGVINLAVAQRRGEFGIRMALGAAGASVRALVLRQGFGLVAAGCGLGLAGGLALRKLVAIEVPGAERLDPTILLGSVVVLALAAFAATLLPAVRASRVDPVSSLRAE